MLFSRLLVPRIKLNVACRPKSIERNLVDELNQIKSKDLAKILNEQQAKDFLQLRRSLGGKFQSLQQFQKESKIQIDFDKFFGYLCSLKDRSENQQHRIHVEPRLTTQLTADIESVCSVDFTSSYINWAIVSTGRQDNNRFAVKQLSSIEVDLYGKYNFIKTFNKLSESLSKVPLNDANVILVEQATYRYSNMKIATYVSQLQQIRAVLNTILHSQMLSKQPVYHISGRDVAAHFGLFIGNEQSSAEFFLTNLIFNNTDEKQKLLLDVDHQLKTSYHGSTKGQKEPMAQCLLRAVAFLQCVNEKKSLSLHKN